MFSPDLATLAFPTFANGVWTIEIRSFDGNAGRRLVATRGLPLAWSPDGAAVAFADDDELWVADVAMASAAPIAPLPVHAAAWSPDSSRLAFISRHDLWLVRRDGGEPRVLARDVSSGLVWSPDGGSLAFARSVAQTPAVPAGDGLQVIDLADGRTARLADGVISSLGIAWAPDGSRIVFVGLPPNRGGVFYGQDYELRAVSASGGRSALIGLGRHPDFSPDGRRLAYAAFGPCEVMGIYVAGPLGGNPRRLTSTCTLRGTRRADVIRGSENSEEIVGLEGADRLYGRQGHDWLVGGPGDDRLEGGLGADRIFAGAGRDTRFGAAPRGTRSSPLTDSAT